jgi:protocatechuate 3,4-dioxygenase beta subunit
VWRIEGTAADGGFRFDALEPGRYSLMGEGPDYPQQQYGAPAGSWQGIDISVEDGEQIRDLEFTMFSPASISGRVTREDGSPAAGIIVELQTWNYARDRRRLFPVASASAGPDGEFLIEKVRPGRYLLSAEVHPGYHSEEPCEVLFRTFHPSTMDASLATEIEIAPGAELRGFEVRMCIARSYRLRGYAHPPQRCSMHIASIAPDIPIGGHDWSPGFSADGSFEFRGVLPGEYILEAWPGRAIPPNSRPIRFHVGRARATVTDADVDGIVVHLCAPLEIRGRVTIEGVDPPPLLPEPEPPPVQDHSVMVVKPADRPWVMLLKSDGIPANAPGAESREDGTFCIENIIPGRFRAIVSGPFPAGTYLKSIHLGDRDITDTEFELTSDPPPLHVLLSPRAATISGIVRDSNGAPVPGAVITYWNPHRPAPPIQLPPATDQKGAFSIRHLPPGEVRLLGAASDLVARDLRPAFENRATTLHLSENSHQTIELQVVPRADIEAAAAKIR